MTSEPEQLKREQIPRGVRSISEARRGRLRIPAIPVRQDIGEPPKFVCPRFGWSVGEVSGSLGDPRHVSVPHRRHDHDCRDGADRYPEGSRGEIVILLSRRNANVPPPIAVACIHQGNSIGAKP